MHYDFDGGVSLVIMAVSTLGIAARGEYQLGVPMGVFAALIIVSMLGFVIELAISDRRELRDSPR